MSDVQREIHLFSGFRQDASVPTGTFRIWSLLHEQFAGPRCIVQMHPWDTPPRVLAQRIRNSGYGSSVDIVLGGYSWGGMTAARVAEQLEACNLRVRKVVLADPVYRHWYALGWWRSLFRWFEIEIPANVYEVQYFLQENPRFVIGRPGGTIQPAGHIVVPEDPQKTTVHDPVYLTCDHMAMDETWQYRDALVEACICDS